VLVSLGQRKEGDRVHGIPAWPLKSSLFPMATRGKRRAKW
jgi:hypothetical protein